MGSHSSDGHSGSAHDCGKCDAEYNDVMMTADIPDEARRGCFPSSALIDTPQGKIQIGNLSVGQMVWSFQSGFKVKRLITKKLVYGTAKIMKVEFGIDEATFCCTNSHSFLTDKGYLALPKIVTGDSIVHMDANGHKSLRRVTSITDTKTREPVFNLYTQGEHNFIVDGYVAHNFTRFRTLRTVFHRLFLDGQVGAIGSFA
jgi:hypothetical protein